jgi:hypothetical protein
MKKSDIEKLKIKLQTECCPVPYRNLPKIFDDYEVNAKILNLKNPEIIRKTMGFVDCETDYVYGPSTGYKSKYSYNRDD